MSGTSDRDNDGMGPAYVVGTLVLAALLLYWALHDYVVWFWFMVKKLELLFIMLWHPHFEMLMNWCNHVLTANVTLEHLQYLAYNISDALIPWAWGLGIIVILLLYFFHPSQKFQRSFSMYKLAYLMCCHFTKVYFPSNRKQEKAAISADARSPYDYLQHYKVLESGQLNESTLYYQLSKDLGAPWSKVKVTNIIVYGLFAAFSACIINQRKVADMLLSELTQYFGDSHTHQNGFKQFLRGRRIAKNIEMIVAEVSMKPVIQKLIGQHFYASTLLCELLNHARKSGIMPSASFLWLKKIDRSLWYALNSVGRKTYFSEGAAIVAHWNAERSLGDQIQYPLVCNVITAFKMEYRLHGSRKDEAL